MPMNEITIDKRTEAKLFIQNGWDVRKAQRSTVARFEACRCVRAVFRYACFKEEYTGHLTPECKHNIDATTVLVSMKGDHYVVVMKDDDDPEHVQALKVLDEGNAAATGKYTIYLSTTVS